MGRRDQAGFSLVELMVALLLATIVTAAVIEVFVSSRQIYRVQDAQSRLQENGRFAMHVLAFDIRKTGYEGCATRSSENVTNTLNNSSNYLWNFSVGVQGFDATGANTWSPTADASISNPLSGTDILTLREVSGPAILVTKHPGASPPGSADIQVNKGNGLDGGDIVMVTDCVASAIFQITSANPDTSGSLSHNTGTGTPGNATKTLGKNYTGAEIFKINTISFYIRNNGNGVPSLYKQVSNNASPEELVEGVENMQILYGVNTNSDDGVDKYVSAQNVTDWSKVLSIRISLLLRSIEDNLTTNGAQAYTFNGSTITPADHRLRAVFTRTITLRNRVP